MPVLLLAEAVIMAAVDTSLLRVTISITKL